MIYSIFAGNDVICKDPLRERSHSSEMCLYIVHLYTNSNQKKENKSRIKTIANHDCKLTVESRNFYSQFSAHGGPLHSFFIAGRGVSPQPFPARLLVPYQTHRTVLYLVP